MCEFHNTSGIEPQEIEKLYWIFLQYSPTTFSAFVLYMIWSFRKFMLYMNMFGFGRIFFTFSFSSFLPFHRRTLFSPWFPPPSLHHLSQHAFESSFLPFPQTPLFRTWLHFVEDRFHSSDCDGEKKNLNMFAISGTRGSSGFGSASSTWIMIIRQLLWCFTYENNGIGESTCSEVRTEERLIEGFQEPWGAGCGEEKRVLQLRQNYLEYVEADSAAFINVWVVHRGGEPGCGIKDDSLNWNWWISILFQILSWLCETGNIKPHLRRLQGITLWNWNLQLEKTSLQEM